jgi:hypothetical protein
MREIAGLALSVSDIGVGSGDEKKNEKGDDSVHKARIGKHKKDRE